MSKAAGSQLGFQPSSAYSFVLVCALGTFATASGPGRVPATLAAALISIAPALLYGVLSHVVVRLLSPALSTLTGKLGLLRFVDRDPSAARQPVILLHASALALALWLGLTLIGSKLLLLRLRRIEELDLRETLSLVSIVGWVLIAALLALAALRPLQKGVTRIDRRIALPLPPSAKLRTLVWLALPLGALASVGLWALEPLMGMLVSPLWLLLVIAVDVALSTLPAQRLPSTRRQSLATAFVLFVTALLGLVVANRLLATSEKNTLALEQATPGSMLLSALRKLSDVDRDGASAFLGEHDCAGFSAKRGPLAREIDGNGIDENCDGQDGKRGSMPKSPTFFGGLRDSDIKEYDIVWFVVDAVRADHTSLLGYERLTTPHLDELAKESLVFTNAYSQSSATMLSIPSMQSGVDPGRVTWSKDTRRMGIAKDQRRYLAHRLASKRYTTGFVSAPYIKSMLPGLQEGYSWISFASIKQTESSSTAATMSAQFIFKAREKRAPFFLLTYMAAPHGPYVTHGDSYPKPPKKATDKDRYDAEIMNADRYIDFVLDVLRQDPARWAKTIVVVTADHGEEFRERGHRNHATTCNVESIHVPLLLRIPGQEAARVTQRVALLDIVPTLLELVGVEVDKPDALDGSSLLLSTLAPERIPQDRPIFCTVVSQKAVQGDFARRSVMSGQWKLMAELRGAKQITLYDIVADPLELSPLDVDGAHAPVAKRLSDWLSRQLTGNVHQIEMSGK